MWKWLSTLATAPKVTHFDAFMVLRVTLFSSSAANTSSVLRSLKVALYSTMSRFRVVQVDAISCAWGTWEIDAWAHGGHVGCVHIKVKRGPDGGCVHRVHWCLAYGTSKLNLSP